MKKSIFIIFFLAIFGFLFNFSVPSVKALTVTEIRAQIQALQQQIQQLQQQLARQQDQTKKWCHDFSGNLKYGNSGSEVKALQTALEKEGFYKRTITGYFDEYTASAVVGFQEKYAKDILSPWGLKYGTGFVGKTTISKLNELYGCEKPVTPVTKFITLLSPNGGEKWVIGNSYDIKWNSSGLDKLSINLIDYTPGDRYGHQYGIVNVSASLGKYSWTIPSNIPVGKNYKIVVGSGSTNDYSNNYFSIISPTTTCHTSPLWSWNYCSPGCPCAEGEGDCDTDADCQEGLYCAQDVGTKYDQSSSMDVCEKKPSITCKDDDWFGTSDENLKKRLSIKGRCTDTTGIYTDTCVNEIMLKDYYCSPLLQDSKSCGYTIYNCQAYGFTGCRDGACVKKPKKVGSLSLKLAADTPVSQIVAVGTNGVSDFAFTKVDFIANVEDINIKSITIEKTGVCNGSNFGSVSLWDGSNQLGTDQYLVNCITTFNFPAGSYWRIPKGVTKTLTIKADLNGIANQYTTGSSSGNVLSLRLINVDAVGAESGSENIIGEGTVNISGKQMILRKSKPTITVTNLPSNVLGAGEKILYRWGISADTKGDIGWKNIEFDINGTLNGEIINKNSITNLKVWDVDTYTEIPGNIVLISKKDGLNVVFEATDEQVISAGYIKTYELRGNIMYSGKTGDAIFTKIKNRSTAPTTHNYTSLLNYLESSFIWTDRSVDNHSLYTLDWTNDYKVPGIPTDNLSLIKEETTTYHTSPLWSWNYCSPGCPCAEGEGDCDTDADCQEGLYCAQDVGTKYDQSSSMDVCEKKTEKFITLLSPNGGETLVIGETYNIKWNSDASDVDRVVIDLINKEGKSVYTIGPIAYKGGIGSYSWSVPSNLSVGDYKIKIGMCPSTLSETACANNDLDSYGSDESDGYFRIFREKILNLDEIEGAVYPRSKCCTGPADYNFSDLKGYEVFYDPKVKYAGREFDYSFDYSDAGVWCKKILKRTGYGSASPQSTTKTGLYISGTNGNLSLKYGTYHPINSIHCSKEVSPVGLENVKNQLASISEVVSQLTNKIKELLNR